MQTLLEIFAEFNNLEESDFSRIPKEFYVYLLYERGVSLPFYVGKGFGNRAWDHLRPSKYEHSNLPVHDKIKNLMELSENVTVEIIFEDLSELEAHQHEKFLIKKYGRRDIGTGCLLNLTNGGEGMVGFKHSQSAKDKVSASKIGNKNWLGRKHKSETCRKMSESRTNKQKVGCFLNGRLISQFKNATIAEQNGYEAKSILRCLKGRRKSYRGMIWEEIQ